MGLPFFFFFSCYFLIFSCLFLPLSVCLREQTRSRWKGDEKREAFLNNPEMEKEARLLFKPLFLYCFPPSPPLGVIQSPMKYGHAVSAQPSNEPRSNGPRRSQPPTPPPPLAAEDEEVDQPEGGGG